MRIRTWAPALCVTLVMTGCDQPPAPPAEPRGLENGSFHAELNGFDIHYEVHGRGPVLMTVPNSWGLTLGGLRALYRPLEHQFRLVYFDPRGMGGSAPIREDADMGMAAVRADFDALRRHLGQERVNAIGWSNGAMNLILLGAEHPDTLSSAIFLHGSASFGLEDMQDFQDRYPELMVRWEAFITQLADQQIPAEQKDERQKRFNVEVMFPMLLADPEGNAGMLAEIYRDVGFSWRHGRYSEAENPTFDARDELARIPVRSLVIYGVRDMLPPAKAEEMHAGLADSVLVAFEESGHYAPLEEPERFIATIAEFLGD